MKKLIALLAACTMMTCAFASCGDDKSSESSSEKSVSEVETEAETTEATTEEETTESETTTEPATEEDTTESISEENTEESIIGMWSMSEDEITMGFDFKDNGNLSMWIDITEIVHFTTDGNFIVDNGVMDSKFISYDGTTFSFSSEDGQDLWTMTKESGSSENYDGEYKLVSGAMYDNIARYDGVDVYIIVSGETMLADYRNALTYTTDGDAISITGLTKMDIIDDDTVNTTYEVKNDTLTLRDFDEGEEWVMTRFDLSGNKTAVSQKTTADTEEDTDISVSEENRTTEGSVIGSWYSTDDNYGFVFDENGTGGVLVYATEMIHFTNDGKLFMSSMTLEPECIDYDGTNLSVSFQGTEILKMKRNDSSNPDSFNGEYTFVSGAFYDGMVSSIGENFGIEPEETVVYAMIDGEKMYIEFTGLFTYSADNGDFIFDGLETLGIEDGRVLTYEFAGDKLILENGVSDELILEKIEY